MDLNKNKFRQSLAARQIELCDLHIDFIFCVKWQSQVLP